MKISFVEYDETFLMLSTKWLFDSEIKKLTMSPDITLEEQKKWYDSLKYRKDYFIEGIVADGEKIGAVGIKNIDFCNKTGEYWGYIGSKNFIGKGIGKRMVLHMCEVGKKLGLKELRLKVIDFNNRAYQLYLSQGFVESDRVNGVVHMSKNI